jgi:hypothetical protein
MAKLKLGRYRHYKNLLVRVIGIGKHSETLEDLVIYEKLENFGGFKKGSLWVRPLKIFKEKVVINGKKVPRFKFIEE